MRPEFTAVVLSLALFAAGSGASFAADADAGKAVYEKSCVSCHGKDGKGNPAMAKVMGEKALNLTTKETADKSDEQLMKVVAEGRGKMPAQKSLSKDDQKHVVAYVRTLSK